MAAVVLYAGRSLLRRPMTPAAVLFDRSPASAAALPSYSLGRGFSSNGSTYTTTKKDLAIELMRNRPLDDKSSASMQICRLNELLDLLEVHHRHDRTMKIDAAAAATRAVEEKKQELALLLHKAEVEGGHKHTAEIREKTAEFAAAAYRLRDLLLPQVQREDIENLKGRIGWLEHAHYANLVKIFGLGLTTLTTFVLAFRFISN